MTRTSPKDLREMCLAVIIELINGGVYTVLESLSPQDRALTSEHINLSVPLRQALQMSLDDVYWKLRSLRDFPAPHATPLPRHRQRLASGGPGSAPQKGSAVTERTSLDQRSAGSSRQEVTSTTEVDNINHMRCSEDVDWQTQYLQQLLAMALGGRRLASEDGDDSVPLNSVTLVHYSKQFVRELRLEAATPHEEGEDFEEEWLGRTTDAINSLRNLKSVSIVLRPRHPHDLQSITAARLARLGCAISAATNITSLQLSQSGLTDVLVSSLLTNISSIASLGSLNLSHNMLGSASAPLLSSLLTSTRLHTLVLSNNFIGADGIAALSDGVCESCTLQYLALDCNPLCTEGTISIMEAAIRSESLTCLSLSGVRAGGAEAEERQLWGVLMAATRRLQYLNITANCFKTVPPPEMQTQIKTTNCWIFLSTIDGDIKFTLAGCHVSILPKELVDIIKETITKNGNSFVENKSCLDSDTDPQNSEIFYPVKKLRPPDMPSELECFNLTPNDFRLEEEIRTLCIFTKRKSII